MLLGFEDRAAVAPAAAGEAAAAPATPAESSTNVQETGVDEPDIVKTDGTTMFVLAGHRLRAVSVAGDVPAVLGSIELRGGPANAYATDSELLFAGDRALVISRSYGNFKVAYAPRTVLTELDVSDPTAIRELSSDEASRAAT